MYAGEHLFAGRALMAGALSRRSGADHGGGKLLCQGVPPGALWPGDEIGVGEAPALLPLGQLLLQALVPRQGRKVHGLTPFVFGISAMYRRQPLTTATLGLLYPIRAK